jgi:hypothetical protein
MRNPRRLVHLASLLALATAITAVADAAPPVAGSVTVNGKKAALVKVYVDESEDDIVVVLASKEIPRDVLPFIGEEVARKQKIYAVTFTVSRAKRGLDPSGVKGVFHPGPDLGYVGLAEGKAKLTLSRLDATGLAGRIVTPAPVSLSDLSYSFDVSFSIPLGKAAPAAPAIQVKVSGDTSPAAGAYADYYRAVFAGNVEQVRGFFASARRRDFDKADAKTRSAMLELAKSNPSQIRIAKAQLKGAMATLTIEGQNETATRSTAEVTMVNEANVWRVEKEKWSITNK